MGKRRIILPAVVLLLLAGIVTILWTALDWPPPRLILKYGFPPTGGPTGGTRVIEGIEFVELSPGYFRMGSNRLSMGGDRLGRLCARLGLPWGRQPESLDDATPEHWVEFPRGFWIARTEITNAQYERFDPRHERSEHATGDEDPVVNVSWEDARRYCRWLSNRADGPIRLPSEAEWECACRSGSLTHFSFGDEDADLGKYAWSRENSNERAHPVGTREPNPWGLYDLHGNVYEWCEDAYHGSYRDAPTDGTAWSDGGEECEPGVRYRVYRGGSWIIRAWFSRSSIRIRVPPTYRAEYVGFRPAFTLPEDG